MRNREQTREAMREIADRLIEIVGTHERDAHGGQPCWLERSNALAYLGHCLMVPADLLATSTIGLLQGYHDNCDDPTCPHAINAEKN